MLSEGIETYIQAMPYPGSDTSFTHFTEYSEAPVLRVGHWTGRIAQSAAITKFGHTRGMVMIDPPAVDWEGFSVTRYCVGTLEIVPLLMDDDLSNNAIRAISLLDEWLNDDSGYDEQTWPELKDLLDRDRLSQRRLFSA